VTSLNHNTVTRRSRANHPERIQVGGEILERNDITAVRYGESERTTNRKDRLGAPYLYIGGCKYRPVERFDAFILSQIIKKSGTPRPRGRR
jgi:hypothetical protein